MVQQPLSSSSLLFNKPSVQTEPNLRLIMLLLPIDCAACLLVCYEVCKREKKKVRNMFRGGGEENYKNAFIPICIYSFLHEESQVV